MTKSTIQVFQAETAANWDNHAQMSRQRRVQNLAPADFSADSELMKSLHYAVVSICHLIALRRLGQGE